MNRLFYGAMAAVILTGSVLTGCSDKSSRKHSSPDEAVESICSFISDKYFTSHSFAGEYVNSVLDASYKGLSEQYMECTDSTEEDAAELYENTVRYYSDSLTYYCQIETDIIGEELQNEFDELAREILSHAQYSISSVEEGDNGLLVNIEISPILILEQCDDGIDDCIIEYNENNNTTHMSKETIKLEKEYAQNILDVFRAETDSIKFGNTVTFTMVIRKDEDDVYYPANENDWNTIDDYVMGLND